MSEICPLPACLQVPIEICEQRDPKGLYKKARAGQLKNFTGERAGVPLARGPPACRSAGPGRAAAACGQPHLPTMSQLTKACWRARCVMVLLALSTPF